MNALREVSIVPRNFRRKSPAAAFENGNGSLHRIPSVSFPFEVLTGPRTLIFIDRVHNSYVRSNPPLTSTVIILWHFMSFSFDISYENATPSQNTAAERRLWCYFKWFFLILYFSSPTAFTRSITFLLLRLQQIFLKRNREESMSLNPKFAISRSSFSFS